jgi:hypothetical protein
MKSQRRSSCKECRNAHRDLFVIVRQQIVIVS